MERVIVDVTAVNVTIMVNQEQSPGNIVNVTQTCVKRVKIICHAPEMENVAV